jgi:hypothetical protein
MPIAPEAAPGTSSGLPPFGSAASGHTGTNTIGRATVERMISQTKTTNKKLVIGISAAVVGLVLLLFGGLHYYQKREARIAEERRLADEARNQQERDRIATQVAQNAAVGQNTKSMALAGVDIAEKFVPSTVFIEVSWKLIDTRTGKQVYHAVKNRAGVKELLDLHEPELAMISRRFRDELPVYIKKGDVIEPVLIVSDGTGPSHPIGGRHTGSGFVVTDNGFILTNRHVAAPWEDDFFGGPRRCRASCRYARTTGACNPMWKFSRTTRPISRTSKNSPSGFLPIPSPSAARTWRARSWKAGSTTSM